MAVADVYTALTEHRPYREGHFLEGVLEFLAEEVRQGKLDRNVLAILQDNIQEIEEARTRAQLEEGSDLEGFWMMDKQIQKSTNLADLLESSLSTSELRLRFNVKIS